MTESRDGAVALMLLVAAAEAQLVVIRHAVSTAPTPQTAVEDLQPLLKGHLDRSELNELFMMMRKVAALHGGPTEGQEKLVGFAERSLNDR